MYKRKVYLISPREPSGATWLINCLLELGIKTFRYSPAGMWRNENGKWFLNRHEQILKKWLPALGDHSSFDFREDLEVQWMHEWFSDAYAGSEILYFVRDPRDALFSRYKREAPGLTYREFADFPDVYTLLDKITNWRLFNEIWLAHPRVSVFRFEDYKANAERTLASVLAALQLEYGAAEISRATRASTFEKAAAAERVYRAEHPEDTQLINRSGFPMEWQSGEMDRDVVARIELVCADLLEQFGYPSPVKEPGRVSLTRHWPRLSFFDRLRWDGEKTKEGVADGCQEDAFINVIEFMASLDPVLLTRAHLPVYELQQLQSSLREYLGSLGNHADACFAQAVSSSVRPDREVMPLARLRRGLSRRVRRLFGLGAR